MKKKQNENDKNCYVSFLSLLFCYGFVVETNCLSLARVMQMESKSQSGSSVGCLLGIKRALQKLLIANVLQCVFVFVLPTNSC